MEYTSKISEQIYEVQATVYVDLMTGTPNVSMIPETVETHIGLKRIRAEQ